MARLISQFAINHNSLIPDSDSDTTAEFASAEQSFSSVVSSTSTNAPLVTASTSFHLDLEDDPELLVAEELAPERRQRPLHGLLGGQHPHQ